jgi:hypothetical protein
LDRISRACFLAESAENTTRKVDPEKGRISSPAGTLCSLQGDTVNRTCSRAQIACHASFIPIRIPAENDPATVAGREIWFLFGVQYRFTLVKGVQEGVPYTSEDAEHII